MNECLQLSVMWVIIGFIGQGLFSARFIFQWIVSERKKQSIIPVGFWYFSLLGGVTLFAYAIHKADPVFIVGQGAGLLVYSRNLYLIRKRAKTDKS
jgi:lipid-A-disaccharide synthase-like uncharacterized protein